MQNAQPKRITKLEQQNSSDTDGMDGIFDSDVADVMSATKLRKKIELPIQEAAKALGISERTMWRRIESGEFTSRIKGNKRFVRVPLAESGVSDDTATDSPATRNLGTVVDFAAILKELTGANYRVGFLQGQLEVKDEQLRLLPDLQARANESADLRMRLAAAEEELTLLRKPWWQRLLKTTKS